MRLHIFNLLVLIAFCSLARAEEVTFRVIDPQNSAVPGATIDIRGTHAIPKVLSGVSDSQGLLKVNVELPVEIQVLAPGFEPLRQKVEKNVAGAIAVQLVPAALHTSIDVVVRDAPGPETTMVSASRPAPMIRRLQLRNDSGVCG